jgi:membrane associated rhomboid family serine protease
MINNQNNSLSGNCCKDCKEFLTGILNSMPFFVKIVVCSTIILYLINFIIPYVAYFLADIPYFTIYYFQIWRIFTTPFITTSLFSVIFSIYFWYEKASRLEKDIGTIKYIIIFFMNSFCIQIMFCILMLLLSLIIRNKAPLVMKISQGRVRNEGIWPILMCDLTLLCLSNPNEIMQFRFFPCTIKAKYYPLFLFLIFTIISGFQIDFENICGIGFGFLYHYFLRNRLKISNNFAEKLGNSCLCRWMKTKKGFIGSGGINTFANIVIREGNNVRNVNISNAQDNINKSREKVKQAFQAFKGKGVVVGGGDNNIQNNENKNEVSKSDSGELTNVTVSSSDEINSSDSRIDLNNSNPKS